MFSPGIDDKSKEPFMPIHPGEAMKKGAHVPILLGFIISEGKNAILRTYKAQQFDCIDPKIKFSSIVNIFL